jgi:hypothetical protein
MTIDELEGNVHEKFVNKANVGLVNLKKIKRSIVEILFRLNACDELGKRRDSR